MLNENPLLVAAFSVPPWSSTGALATLTWLVWFAPVPVTSVCSVPADVLVNPPWTVSVPFWLPVRTPPARVAALFTWPLIVPFPWIVPPLLAIVAAVRVPLTVVTPAVWV